MKIVATVAVASKEAKAKYGAKSASLLTDTSSPPTVPPPPPAPKNKKIRQPSVSDIPGVIVRVLLRWKEIDVVHVNW